MDDYKKFKEKAQAMADKAFEDHKKRIENIVKTNITLRDAKKKFKLTMLEKVILEEELERTCTPSSAIGMRGNTLNMRAMYNIKDMKKILESNTFKEKLKNRSRFPPRIRKKRGEEYDT